MRIIMNLRAGAHGRLFDMQIPISFLLPSLYNQIYLYNTHTES